jgi:hypothetical protein
MLKFVLMLTVSLYSTSAFSKVIGEEAPDHADCPRGTYWTGSTCSEHSDINFGRDAQFQSASEVIENHSEPESSMQRRGPAAHSAE